MVRVWLCALTLLTLSCEGTSPARPSPSAPRTSVQAPADPSTEASKQAAPNEKQVIYVQPLGPELPDEDVRYVETSLRAFFDFDVQSLDRIELPKSAMNGKRTRYRAEKLLRVLEERRPDDGFRILGLTSADISTTKGKHADWGILGLATIDGRACVISSFRTKRAIRNAAHARERLGKVVVHEIGHTLGLPHCPNRGCLMEDAQGTVLTTDREYDLCHDCRMRLERRGHPLAGPEVPIPWPEVEAR